MNYIIFSANKRLDKYAILTYNNVDFQILGYRQVVRQRLLVPPFVGSNPTTPAKKQSPLRRFFICIFSAFHIVCTQKISQGEYMNRVRIYTLPGGKMPERQTAGAIGYDVCIRAVVSPSELDPLNLNLRKTLFDFKNRPDDELIAQQVFLVDDELVYRMNPGESVLIGIGFVTEMIFPMFYWVAPRSGLSSKYGITVTNAPGTVDPDYRGEAGVLVYNRTVNTFDLRHDMRIAQIIYQNALIPETEEVSAYEELGATVRGAGGFGSTGLK
jgi:dUTP pyrophosphatase